MTFPDTALRSSSRVNGFYGASLYWPVGGDVKDDAQNISRDATGNKTMQCEENGFEIDIRR